MCLALSDPDPEEREHGGRMAPGERHASSSVTGHGCLTFVEYRSTTWLLAGGEAFVSLGCLLVVEVGGWDDVGVTVEAHAHDPPLMVLNTVLVLGFDLLVVVSAQQGAVGQRSLAVTPPGDDVVGVAGAGRTVAAGERAALISDGEGLAEDAAEQALLAAEVEGLAGAVADDGEDVGVAGEESCLLCVELFTGVEQGGGC